MNIFQLGRVYIRLGKGFNFNGSLNFDDLLLLYAKAKQEGRDQQLLIEHDFMFRGRTIACLADESNRFIKGLSFVSSDEDMAAFVSQHQIRLLGRALAGKRKKISGYSIIIIHCMYKAIRDYEHENYDLLKKCATLIRDLVQSYYEDYPDDDIARFLLRCAPEVIEELNDPRLCKLIDDFPDIPKCNIPENVE